MPDVFDRARLAVVAMLASFVLVALALFSHVASSSLTLPIGGAGGQGTVLTTSRASGAQHGTSATAPTQGFIIPAGPTGPASSASAVGAPASFTAGSGNAGAGNVAAVEPGGQIGVSVGSGPAQTSPTVIPPASTPSTGTSSGSGSGTGTGSSGTGTGTGSTGSSDDPSTGLPGDSAPTPSDPSNGHGGTTPVPMPPLPGHDPTVPVPPTTPGTTTGSTTGTGTAGVGTGTDPSTSDGITPLDSPVATPQG